MAAHDGRYTQPVEVHHQQLLLGTCFVVVAEQRLRIVAAIGGEEFRRDPLLGPEMGARLTHSDYGVCEPSANDALRALPNTRRRLKFERFDRSTVCPSYPESPPVAIAPHRQRLSTVGRAAAVRYESGAWSRCCSRRVMHDWMRAAVPIALAAMACQQLPPQPVFAPSTEPSPVAHAEMPTKSTRLIPISERWQRFESHLSTKLMSSLARVETVMATLCSPRCGQVTLLADPNLEAIATCKV